MSDIIQIFLDMIAGLGSTKNKDRDLDPSLQNRQTEKTRKLFRSYFKSKSKSS
jgi:hypothetical protein